VIGAGIGGLAAAMALSRIGWQVTVVERDDTPMPVDVEGAFAWDRRGAPQVRHTHGFPALIRVILRDRYPDVLAALLEAGVAEVSIMPPSVPRDAPNYARDAEDLQVLSCRRTTLEWVLRRCALAESGVRLEVGVGVDGLLASSAAGAPLTIGGVRLDDGSELAADVVVACSGRRGDVPGWFAAHDVVVPEDERPTGTIYLSRFYRRPAGDDAPIGYVGGRRAGLGFVVAGADNGTYSATLAVDADDDELRSHLLDPDRFEAVLPLFREMEPVVRGGGTPITPVQAMGGLINRIRRFLDADGQPLAHGFFAVGDAHTCTNPVYGRGSSLAVLQAVLVVDALAAHPDDADVAARTYEAASATRVEPWFDVSVLTDEAAAATRAARRAGPAMSATAASAPRADIAPDGAAAASTRRPPTLDLQALRRIAGSGDPELAVLVARTMSLLLTPQEVFGDPAVLDRLAAAAGAERPADPARPRRVPLTRADLLAAGRP
jgi:2-polyprenyl-6-methoxyphenol hydroxylase-like FAD-dependent oxidoreductase